MQILALSQNLMQKPACLSGSDARPILALTSLPFNPLKLVGLIAWIYLCLYLVQYFQFSPLVPKRYKSFAYIIGLFAGPILLLLLLIVDIAKKSTKSGDGIAATAKQQVKNALAGLRSRKLKLGGKKSIIRLLDSSGRSINEIYGHSDSKRQDSHVLDLTEQVIADALAQRASDVLIDPADELTYTIRLRIDGVLRPVRQLKAETCKAVVNSIKAVAGMDISEKRRPQDGAFIAKKGEITASFRVASAGVLHGEKLSIRVLNQDAGTFILTDVGFRKKHCATIQSALSKPSGMVLVCGPTGSGKTTTMYAMLNEIDRLTHNVVTVEDPIEAVLKETSQIEINPKADITFAKALRSILRQDPDVICVGEIRDEETAEIALRASQTGHLVLATVHCYSNTAAIIRLLDLGVSPLLLSSGLSLLVSQRLLRLLCKHCKKPAVLSEGLVGEFQRKKIDYTHIFEPVGCKNCGGTGYFGRTAICDPLVVTDEFKADIANNEALLAELRTEGRKRDRLNLRKEGLKMVASGLTSLAELKRIVG
jgi:general secretion pathway protein E